MKTLLSTIKDNQYRLSTGKFNTIPWSNFPILSTSLPGVQQGKYYIVTASQKVGKTQLTDSLFLYEVIKFFENNNTDLDYKIFYFSLEMSKDTKRLQILSNLLYRYHGYIVPPEVLMGSFTNKNYILPKEILELLETTYFPYLEELEKKITIIDNIRNPFGIYNYIREYANASGVYVDKEGVIVENPKKEGLRIDRYIPNNPKEYVIVITDHISLLHPEKGHSGLHKAILEFSGNYCLSMRDRWNYTVVNVQQQSAEAEKQQFTYKGQSIIQKLKPSPDNLADCKYTARDCNKLISLFAPQRYGFTDYKGYDLKKLKNNFRILNINLNRDGFAQGDIPLFFNGAVNSFRELELPQKINYEKIIEEGKSFRKCKAKLSQ